MSYMLLIVEPQGQRPARAQAEGQGLYRRMLDYTDSLKARGVLLASDSLRARAAPLQRRARVPLALGFDDQQHVRHQISPRAQAAARSSSRRLSRRFCVNVAARSNSPRASL